MAEPTIPKTDEDRIETENETQETDTVEDAEIVQEAAAEAQPATEPDPATEPAPEPDPAPVAAPAAQTRRGPGFVPLVLGGVIAAGLGYGAAYMGLAATEQDTGTEEAISALQATLAEQTESLSALTTRASALEDELAALPPAPDPVDLSPLAEDIAAVETRIDSIAGQVSGLTDRVAYLETLPLGEGGEGGDNTAAMAAAVAQLQAQIQEQSENLSAQQAQNAALAEEIRTIAAEAEASISAAEERAAARVGAATAQAALGQLRIAVASGAPFAEALADVTAGSSVELPEALAAAAETGVPTLDELQSTFPAAARAALPVALRDTAGEGAMDRFTAFLQSQVGGRSLEPREGDDPDAVLSRAEAAVREGDLSGAIAELEALPEEARSEMAAWVASAESRLNAMAALDAFAAALDGTN